MTTDPQPHAHDDTSAVEALLTADALSALMRSTWTWDDRALRRDLSELLVDLDAARLVGEDVGAHDAIGRRLCASAHADAARFAAAVLGPKLIADTGNPLRDRYVEFASDRARFTRQAHAATRDVQAQRYFSSHIDVVDYAPESTWQKLVASEGATGLGTALRAYGYRFGDSAFFASTALACQAVSDLRSCEAAVDYAGQLQSGDLVGTLAAAEESGSWDPALVRTRARSDSGSWQISGAKYYVPAADAADVIFVIARSVAGPSLFAIDANSPGLTVEAHRILDDTRPLFGVTLSDTPATLLGSEGSGGRLMSRLLDRATIALAAEQVGLIDAAIAVVRGAAPADDVRVVDVVLHHATAHALWQRALSDPAPEAAAAAHIGCTAAAVEAATTAAALCGPDGATTALQRRVLSGALLFGGPAVAHERLLDRLGI